MKPKTTQICLFTIMLILASVSFSYALTTLGTLSAPNGLSASTISSSQINLAWTDNSGDESAFHIERKPSGGSWGEIDVVPADTVSYQDMGVSSSTTYSYRVRAYRNSDAQYSPYSNEVNVTWIPVFVVPEFWIGSIVGLTAFFAAFLFFVLKEN